MPSFDVVSEVDQHELANAVDQAHREISNRFDFKGSSAKIELADGRIQLHADSDFQIQQIHPVLYQKLTSRQIDIACLEAGKVCLLYTSPSPRDRTRTRMPSSA